MQLTLAHIGPKPGKSGAKSNYESLTRLYLDRIAPYYPIQTEAFSTEAAFLAWLAQPKQSGKAARLPAVPVLLDSRGRQLASTEFAQWIGLRRDQGTQHMVFAIGPADGWTETARSARALGSTGMLLSFGLMTMAHELARLVLAEQLYRACTILAGHPYHSGHS
jgi:23S rRNA (pseudouridine1915-N3)-methyltransferase